MDHIKDVIFTPLQVVNVLGGNVLHAMNSSDGGYAGFGEAYFSAIEHGSIKAWKKHREMILNLVVPIGVIRFVIYDDRQHSSTLGRFQEIILSMENYGRLTIPPMVWVGFQGLGSSNMLLNIANIPHNPDEVERKVLDEIKYNWSGVDVEC